MKTLIPVLAITFGITAFAPYGRPQAGQEPPVASADSVYRNISNNAWMPGEKLNYRVHYGFVNAGLIEMKIEESLVEISGRQVYHINAKGNSVSGFDWIYKVRDHFQTYVDEQAIQPLQFVKRMEEGTYKDSDFVLFNYKTKKISSKKGNKDMPKDVQDVISAIYYARTLNIKNAKKGDIFPLNVYLDGEVFNLNIKYMGKETLKTDIGKVHAVKFIPQVVADRIFKDNNALELWVSDDENKVPLRVKAELLVGSVKIDLTSYSGLKNTLNKVN